MEEQDLHGSGDSPIWTKDLIETNGGIDATQEEHGESVMYQR